MEPGLEAAAPEDDDRFTVLGRLGAGGMGVVYRVHDRVHHRELALKTLTGTSPRDLYRFKREFRALCDLVHPNLCALDELHTTGDEWFFTMELVRGVSFIDWVRPSHGSDRLDEPRPPLRSRAQILAAEVDLARLEEALAQLCDGVAALHVAGKLHRDLKPSNVLCEPAADGSGGRVVLLDFGLVAELERPRPEHTHAHAAVGTPAYMSPEQAADTALGPATDWYAVGVILYEALTGRRPIEGASGEVLRRKQLERPPPARMLAPATPAALDELCTQLLDPDPRQRPDGRAVLAALGRAPSEATLSITRTTAAGPFVGRGAQLAALTAARAAARGAGAAVLVRGASGMGKSALLGRFLARLGPDVLLLAGRCYERDNVPYKTLDTLIDALTDALLALGPEERADVLPVDVVALARLFPVLRRVPEISEPRVMRLLPADPQELRARAWTALRALLARLAARREVVVFVDDLQWGDLDSVGFLADLIARVDRPPILVVLAHREEDAAGPIVAELTRRLAAAAAPADVRTVAVTALAPDEARALVEQLAGPAAARDVATIVRDAGGHTMFLAELAHAAADDDAAPSLDQLLAARVARLPPDARAVLVAGAVAARAITVDVVARAAGVADATAALALLRGERLIRTSPGAGDAIEPFHDRVRAAVVDALDADALRATHRALAAAYRAAAPAAHERFIDHLLGAGLDDEAAAAATTAAAAAEDALAFQRAADLYAIALAHGDAAGTARGALLVARARALVNAGRLLEAAEAYAAAAPLVAPSERIEVARQRTEQTLRAGRLVEGMAQARVLLAELGYRLPTTARGGLLALVRQRVALRLRGLGSSARTAAELSPAALVQADVLWSIAAGLSFANPVLGRLVQAWHLRETLALGEPGRLVAAFSLEIGYLAGIGGAGARRRIERVAPRARALAERHGDGFLRGLIQAGQGFADYMFGEFDAARAGLTASLTPMRDHLAGDRWQIDLAELFLLAACLQAGRITELVAHTRSFLADAIDRGDVYAQHGIRSWRGNVTWLVLDRPDEARRHVDEVARERGAVGDFHINEWYQLLAHTQVDLYLGDGGAALARLDAARDALVRSHLLRLGTVRVEAQYLEGRAAVAAALATPADAPALLVRARRCTAVLAREELPWARAVGRLLDAGVAAAAGDREAAARGYVDAVGQLEAAHMRLLVQVARLAHGELVGGADGAANAAAAVAWMAGEGIVDPARCSRLFAPRA